MQQQSLKKLEHKLADSILMDDDAWRLEQLNERYEKAFEEIINFYKLEDMPQIFEHIKEVVRIAQIKEYFLQKEMIEEVAKILTRFGN